MNRTENKIECIWTLLRPNSFHLEEDTFVTDIFKDIVRYTGTVLWFQYITNHNSTSIWTCGCGLVSLLRWYGRNCALFGFMASSLPASTCPDSRPNVSSAHPAQLAHPQLTFTRSLGSAWDPAARGYCVRNCSPRSRRAYCLDEGDQGAFRLLLLIVRVLLGMHYAAYPQVVRRL
jgi:hypothetical protein